MSSPASWTRARLHTVKADSVYFKGHLCFQKEWAGFDTIKPINVIIGRNNSGKSHLLDLVEALSETQLSGRGWRTQCRGVLDEKSLRGGFDEMTSGGDLLNNHWHHHGKLFVDKPIAWEIDTHGKVSNVDFPTDSTLRPNSDSRVDQARRSTIEKIVRQPTHQLNGRLFRRLLADRDIKTELPKNEADAWP